MEAAASEAAAAAKKENAELIEKVKGACAGVRRAASCKQHSFRPIPSPPRPPPHPPPLPLPSTHSLVQLVHERSKYAKLLSQHNRLISMCDKARVDWHKNLSTPKKPKKAPAVLFELP